LRSDREECAETRVGGCFAGVIRIQNYFLFGVGFR
jgi:hypothetical protein